MKKIMAIAVALVMALSMCSFSVMAEDVTFADIANGQLQKFVIGDLDFSGYTVTSSNTAIIAEDGTVTRPLFEDKVVTLTVDGTPIDVTVKAQTSELLYANDFSADLGEGWTLNVPAGNTVPSVNDGVFNVIIGETTVNRTNLYYTLPELVSDGIVTLSFDMSNIRDLTASGIDIRMDGERYDENGEVVGSFNTVTIARCNSATGFGSNWMGAYSKDSVTIKYDPMTGEFWGNGRKGATREGVEYNLFGFEDANSRYVEGKSEEDVAKAVITKIFICNAGGGCTGSFDMDNLAVTQEVSADDVIANATPAQKADYYSQYLEEAYVADGGSFAALSNNLKFDVENLPEDVTIAWETDEDVIKADGTVLRNISETKTTTITGTLSVDGAEDIVKTYDVTLLALNIAGVTEVLDGEYGDAGTSFAGQFGWLPGSIRPYESMTVQKEANGNKFLRFGVSAYEPTGSTPNYAFKSVPGSDKAETIIFEAKVRNPEKVKGVANFTFLINGTEVGEFINHAGYIYDNNYHDGSRFDDYYGGSTGTSRNDMLMTANQWYNLKIVIDLDSADAVFYINDKVVGEHKTKDAAAIEEITSVGFLVKCRGTMDSASEPTYAAQYYDVDDVKAYTLMSDADAFLDAADEVKFEFLKSYLTPAVFANGESLAAITKDLSFAPAGIDLDAIGASLVWESSDEKVIATDGKITPDAVIGKPVTVKGTLTVGSMAPISASYAVTVAPAGTAPYATSAKETFLWDFEDKEDGEVDPKAGAYDNNVKGFGIDGTGDITYVEDAERGMVAKFEPASENANLKFFTGARSGDYVSRYIAGIDFKYDMLDDATRYELMYLFRGNSGGYAQGGISNSDGTEVAIIAPAESNVDGVQRKGTVDMLFGYELDHVESIFNDDIWHNITIDYNTKANVYYVYFDGILVSNAPSATAQIAGYPMMWMQLATRNMESVLIDNHYVVEFTDDDAVVADAALKVALYNAVSRETGQGGVGGPYRQIHRNDLNSVLVKAIPTPQTASNGATLSWTVNGVAHTADTFTPPANAEFVDFKVTATYNGKSATESFANRMASVKVIDFAYATIDGNQSYTAAKISGDVSGKKLIVKYTSFDGSKTRAIDFYAIEDYYNAETGLFTFPTPYQYAGEGGGHLKCYIWDANGITPISFVR